MITAIVIEAAGTPPHAGTQITFGTTLGSVQPIMATTDASGLVSATFFAGPSTGTATVSATSGTASSGTNGSIKIAVGTSPVAAVQLAIGASPASLPSRGGTSTITVSVVDTTGAAQPRAQVTFSTTAGTLSPVISTTDATGVAQTSLTTSSTATVTASVGTTSVSVIVVTGP